jgi:DNA ligase 1
MKYKELANVFEELSSTSSRLKKTQILAKFLQQIPQTAIEETVLLLEGRVFPEWDSRTVGIAAKLVLKVIAQASGYDESAVTKSFQKYGDLGMVAQELFAKKKQQTLFSKPLTVHHVFVTLQHVASMQGTGSQERKLAELSKLLTSADSIEAKFIVRTVLEDLRVGIAIGTLRDALFYAFFTTSFDYDESTKTMNSTIKEGFEQKETLEKIKRALDLTADFAVVMSHIRLGESLDSIKLSVGTPARCMLARKEQSFSDAFARTGLPARVEYKYDGFRLQVHKKGTKVQLFTRRLEDVTAQFPDIVSAVRGRVVCKTCILDAEAVGYDPKTGAYMPFQHISKRIRRKYDIEKLAKELPVELVLFDVVSVEGDVLLSTPLKDRLKILRSVLDKDVSKHIRLVTGILVSGEEEAQVFYQKSLDAGNEGVMIKNLAGLYEPGGRVSAWIKMKPTMTDLDLVIVGAEWGTGKRSAWMTSFTLACRNEDGELLTIGKVGTGMKELDNENPDAVTFAQLTELLEPLVISRKGQEVVVKADVVLSIAYEEIQKSPTYESGYALRFPRVMALRSDRNIEDISSLEEVEELYYEQ